MVRVPETSILPPSAAPSTHTPPLASTPLAVSPALLYPASGIPSASATSHLVSTDLPCIRFSNVDSPSSTHSEIPDALLSSTTGATCATLSDSFTSEDAPRTCSCLAVMSETTDIAPTSPTSPGWDKSWSLAEIQKEEARRMCWSALKLAAGHIPFHPGAAELISELSFATPDKFGLFFPGEALFKTGRYPVSTLHSPKESIWAIASRCMLLFQSCDMHSRTSPQANDTTKAMFAFDAWAEVKSLEEAIQEHTCLHGPGYQFLSKQYLFFTRMVISEHYGVYIPKTAGGFDAVLDRARAEEWLDYHRAHGMTLENFFTSAAQAKPYFHWWMIHILTVCLSLWSRDHTFIAAIEVGKMYLAAAEYLGQLWPCAEQASRTKPLREKLILACIRSGVAPPPSTARSDQ